MTGSDFWKSDSFARRGADTPKGAPDEREPSRGDGDRRRPPGTGATIVRRFARDGYSVAMLARTIADNAPLSLAGMKATILRAIF